MATSFNKINSSKSSSCKNIIINNDKRKWIELINNTNIIEEENIPPGWYTCKEISKIINKSRSHTRKLLYFLMQKNKVERKKFKVKSPNSNMIINNFFYKIKSMELFK